MNENNNVVSFFKKSPIANFEYETLTDAINLIGNIPEDVQLTDLAKEFSGPINELAVLYDLTSISGSLNRHEIGVYNFMALLHKTITEKFSELNKEVPTAIPVMTSATMSIQSLYEKEIAINMLSSMVPDTVMVKVNELRKLVLLYRLAEISFSISVGSRIGHQKYCITNTNVHLAKPAHQLQSINQV